MPFISTQRLEKLSYLNQKIKVAKWLPQILCSRDTNIDDKISSLPLTLLLSSDDGERFKKFRVKNRQAGRQLPRVPLHHHESTRRRPLMLDGREVPPQHPPEGTFSFFHSSSSAAAQVSWYHHQEGLLFLPSTLTFLKKILSSKTEEILFSTSASKTKGITFSTHKAQDLPFFSSQTKDFPSHQEMFSFIIIKAQERVYLEGTTRWSSLDFLKSYPVCLTISWARSWRRKNKTQITQNLHPLSSLSHPLLYKLVTSATAQTSSPPQARNSYEEGVRKKKNGTSNIKRIRNTWSTKNMRRKSLWGQLALMA